MRIVQRPGSLGWNWPLVATSVFWTIEIKLRSGSSKHCMFWRVFDV